MTTRHESGGDVLSALAARVQTADPIAQIRCLADVSNLGEEKLTLLTGIWQHHVMPLKADCKNHKRKFDEISRELEAERAPKRARIEEKVGIPVSTPVVEPQPSNIQIPVQERKVEREGKVHDEREFLDNKHAEQDFDNPEPDPQFMEEIKVSPGSYPTQVSGGLPRFKSVLVYGKLFTVGDLVYIDNLDYDEECNRCERRGQAMPVRPIAKIEALFLDADDDMQMWISWCYTGADIRDAAPRISSATLRDFDIHDNDYVLSNHGQSYPVTGIHIDSLVMKENIIILDTIVFDIERKTLSFISEMAPDRKVQDRAATSTVYNERNAFFDCLLMDPSMAIKSTFWRRCTDTALKNLCDHGRPDNKQRQVLEEAKYEYEYKKLNSPVVTICFCCNMKKSCTWKVVKPRLGLGGLASNLTKHVGTSCHARLVKVRDFIRFMTEKSRLVHEQNGNVLPATVDSWWNRVRLLLV